MSRDESMPKRHVPRAIELSLRLDFDPNSGVHIPQWPSMKNSPVSEGPITTPNNSLRIKLPKSTLPPHSPIHQSNKLPKSPRPQTTNQPIKRMQTRQHRHPINQKKMQHISPKPKHTHQQHQPKLQNHQQTTPHSPLLQLKNHQRIARLHRTLQHPHRPLVVKMMESETKRPQDSATVVLVPGFERHLLIPSRPRADRRERRIRSVHRIRDEGNVRRARARGQPGVDVGVQV